MSSQSYGSLVYSDLEPLFANSLCEAWHDDFLKHDKRMFQTTAIPGMQYIWAVRQHGTHLVPLGIGQEATALSAALAFDQRYEIRQVTVTKSGCLTRALSKSEALSRIAAPVAWSVRRTANLHGGHNVVWSSGSTELARASFQEIFDRQRSTCRIQADLSLEPGLDSLTAMRIRLNLEVVITQAVSTLFWSFEALRIDGLDVLVWTQRVTRVAAPVLEAVA